MAPPSTRPHRQSSRFRVSSIGPKRRHQRIRATPEAPGRRSFRCLLEDIFDTPRGLPGRGFQKHRGLVGIAADQNRDMGLPATQQISSRAVPERPSRRAIASSCRSRWLLIAFKNASTGTPPGAFAQHVWAVRNAQVGCQALPPVSSPRARDSIH